ncbi:hypothetical protein [Leptodesmis sichuanensis]
MLALGQSFESDTPTWQDFYEKLQTSTTLASLVLTAWQMGLWFAKTLVEQQLDERAKRSDAWGICGTCGHCLQSKGFVSRRILTLVGWVEWKRRVGRCPNQCPGSYSTPFDRVLAITPYQQTSIELMRLGCLLAVFLPFELAVQLLEQLCSIRSYGKRLKPMAQRFHVVLQRNGLSNYAIDYGMVMCSVLSKNWGIY